MHIDFADWYRITEVEPNGSILEARWEGVVKAGASNGIEEIFDFVRLFYGRPLRENSSLPAFQAKFKEADSTFRMKDNNLELQVLAGATLVYMLENGPSKFRDVVALATVAAFCQGLRNQVIIPDVVNQAKNYLRDKSSHLRKAQELTYLKDSAPEAIKQTVNVLIHQQRMRQEESDILWWLFGECSRDLNQKFSEINYPAATIIMGKELGDLVVVPPGPLPAETFLTKMLKGLKPCAGKSHTTQKAVAATPKVWREEWMKNVDVEVTSDICPIMLATKNSLETNKVTEWLSAFKNAAGIDASTPIEPLSLAFQVYQECLLVSAMP